VKTLRKPNWLRVESSELSLAKSATGGNSTAHNKDKNSNKKTETEWYSACIFDTLFNLQLKHNTAIFLEQSGTNVHMPETKSKAIFCHRCDIQSNCVILA